MCWPGSKKKADAAEQRRYDKQMRDLDRKKKQLSREHGWDKKKGS